MKAIKNIKEFSVKHPKLMLLGYKLAKEAWRVQSRFIDYAYPRDSRLANIPYKKVLEYNRNRDFGPKKRICYAPFNNMHFKINGEISGCSFNKTYIIGDIRENTLHDIWFSEQAHILRNNIANYNFENCLGCKAVLDAGNYRSFPANKYDYYSSDDAVYPNQMSFETSNLCNLECVMCDEELSSSIRKNRAKLPPLKDVYPDDFIEQLKEFVPHLSIATFIGGEPLLIKRYYAIWEEIIRSNPDCKIHLQTNATYLPQKFIDLLESRQFDVGISLEGCTKATYEKIRIRGNFETLEKNIRTLVALKDAGKVYLNFNFCPLTLNWEEIPRMVDYANRFNVPLKLLNVETPRNLALGNQGVRFLERVYEHLLEAPPEAQGQGFTFSRNQETYNFFIKTIEYYLTEARKREAFFEAYRDKTVAELLDILRADFLGSRVLDYIPAEEKISLTDTLHQIIRARTENPELVRRTLLRFCYFFKGVMQVEDVIRDKQKSIEELHKNAREYFDLEQALYEAEGRTEIAGATGQ